MILVDSRGRFTAVNPAAARLFAEAGLTATPRSLSACSRALSLSARDGTPLPQLLAGVLAGEAVRQRELLVEVAASGRALQVTLSIAPLPARRGAVSLALITLHCHPAEAVRQNELLQQSHHEWLETFNAIPDQITLLDNHFHIRRINTAMAQKLGVAPEQAVGRRCYELFHHSDGPPCVCPHQVMLHDGREHITELHEPSTDSDYLVSVTPIYDSHGSLKGCVHVARDISECKQIQTALRQKTDELTHANQELEAFGYSVSHDLRTPLRAIMGFTELLAQEYGDRLDEIGEGYLRRIRAGGQKMDQLIRDLLSFSRAASVELQRREVDLSGLAAAVLEELRQAQPGRSVAITVAPGCRLQADPDLLRVVMANLLGNAWKYTARTVTPRIEFGCVAQDARPVYFVKDNGAGFDMAFAHRLFEPFQRLHTDKEFPGSGIGLATVKRILRRFGGRIWAESSPGAGATFFFTVGEE
jgi:PAS domain S-box-containing protein